jgi:glucose-1-phosphate adenylyltransferase
MILILSADHIYTMDYGKMIAFHLEHKAELTMAAVCVPMDQTSRFGNLTVDSTQMVKTFVEKPKKTRSCLANMGVYLFNREILDRTLWQDHLHDESSHDFGKDILPDLIKGRQGVYAYSYDDYWMDVGTINSYWQAHMDMLSPKPPLKMYNRNWIIHTRTEERPPSRIPETAFIYASMISDGCYIEENARVESSVLSPGVIIRPGAVVRESVIMTDTVVEAGTVIERAVIDKRVKIGENARIGGGIANPEIILTVIGKNSIVPPGTVVEPGAAIGTDVIASDYPGPLLKAGENLETKRQPYEI